MDLQSKRVLVTGGSGFLGRHVLSELEERGFRHVSVPTRSRFDLIQPEQVRALLEAEKPQIVVHLAARVGGIGADRRLSRNLLLSKPHYGIATHRGMPTPGDRTIRRRRHHLLLPQVHARALSREADLWNGYPEETNAPTAWPRRC